MRPAAWRLAAGAAAGKDCRAMNALWPYPRRPLALPDAPHWLPSAARGLPGHLRLRQPRPVRGWSSWRTQPDSASEELVWPVRQLAPPRVQQRPHGLPACTAAWGSGGAVTVAVPPPVACGWAGITVALPPAAGVGCGCVVVCTAGCGTCAGWLLAAWAGSGAAAPGGTVGGRRVGFGNGMLTCGVGAAGAGLAGVDVVGTVAGCSASRICCPVPCTSSLMVSPALTMVGRIRFSSWPRISTCVPPLGAAPMILASSTWPDCRANACSAPARAGVTNWGSCDGINMAFRPSAAPRGDPY